MILLAWVFGCGGGEPTTERGLYRLEWTTEPAPIPTSELFVVRVELKDPETGAPVEDATVRVDATMPAHGHGMATRPEPDPGVCTGGTCTHPGGVYTIRGLKLHMPGEWQFRFEVEGPAGADALTVTRNQ